MSVQRIAMWTLVLVAIVAALGYRSNVMREPKPTMHRLVFVTGGSSPFWQLTANGARAAARKENAELVVVMPAADENVEQQTKILGGLDLDKFDGIAISPLDAEGQTELINQLAGQKIVVTFDSDAPKSNRQSHIGTSNFSAGRACARVVSEALPQGGKVAVLLVNTTKENMIDRKGGFQERIGQLADDVEEGKQGPKFAVVGYFEDYGDTAKCEANIKQALADNSDLACFVGMNAQHGPIMVRVLKDMNKLGQIKLVTFDTEPETLAGIEAGHIHATLAQDPFTCGFRAVRLLNVLVGGDPFEVPIVGTGANSTGFDVVSKENLANFRAALEKQQQAAQGQESAAAAKPKKAA